MKKWPALAFALAALITVAAQTRSGLIAKNGAPETVYSTYAPADSVKTDPETGLAVDEHLTLVKGQCTACHSSKLILQSHFSRDKWIERIRWMQRTQKLWDLGESEPAILAYLVKHYGPIDQPFDGRREPLKATKWHKLETGR
ncbi:MULTISPECIES: hypothetical protein [Spirosoma]|nr:MULTISPECIES: hypothetical protein [Spirosoma]UHG89027.1 hypothetical protein LQ777_12295 [Spirosoma oryzicola]